MPWCAPLPKLPRESDSSALSGREASARRRPSPDSPVSCAGDLVWWLKIRPGLNDCLESLLLELGRSLSAEGFPALRDYLLATLPDPSLGTATRLALDGLARSPRLMVLDDFDRVLDPAPIVQFLQESVDRVEQLTVITVGRSLVGGAVLRVPPLSGGEVAELVEAVGMTLRTEVVRALHGVVGGHTGLVAAAAAWWSNGPDARRLFERQVANRGVLSNLRDVAGFSRAKARDLAPAHGT